MQIKTLLPLCALALSTACGDPQTDTEYQGQPLLTIKGSVRDVTADTTNTVPAIAFFQASDESSKSGIYLMDADVQGSFPSKFTLNLFQPPPAEVMVEVPAEESDGSDRPLFYAFGEVAAAHAGFPVGLSTVEYNPADEGGISTLTQCVPNGDCFVSQTGCTDDCTVTPDPRAPSRLFYQWIAGVSDVNVVYLSRDIDVSTEKGRQFVSENGVSTKGYHLLQDVRYTDEEEALALACEDQAWANVSAQYEREHDLPWDDTGLPEEEVTEFTDAVSEEEVRLACPKTNDTMEAPSGRSIVVRMYKPEERI